VKLKCLVVVVDDVVVVGRRERTIKMLNIFTPQTATVSMDV
jgi:hypothetical protein